MDCVTSGLPISAKEYLFEAFNQAFGKDMVQIVEVDANQLRSRVRMSSKNVADVLVVLDGVSANKCADIENGLYASDKYHEYSTDEELVNFLNAKFELNLEIKAAGGMEIAVEKGSAEQDMIIEKLREQVGDRDSIIASLKAQVADLKSQIEDGDFGGSEDEEKVSALEKQIEVLRQENLKARSDMADTQAQLKYAEESEAKLRIVVESVSRESENLKTENNQLMADYKAVQSELSDFKIKFSNSQGTLGAKERELEELRKGSKNIKEYEDKIASLEEEISSIKEELESEKVRNSQYQLELNSKDEEISRLSIEAESTELEEELSKEKNEIMELQKVIVDLKSKLATAEGKVETLKDQGSAEVDKLHDENSSLKEKLNTMDQQFIQLNEELIKAKATADMLEKSTSRDTDVESMYQEMNELRNQYAELSQSVFGRMQNYSSPNSSIMIDLIKSGDRYNHLRFVFSGSTESRKGTYRSLLDEFKQFPDQKVVIVDATCETCVDYVFEIKKVVKGLNWFVKGGGILPYLSETCLPNVKVLSPGLDYINDCYFLTVDWERRLKELDNSGYNVVVYCGDISSMVGRILHETLASRGASMVYVHGNAIGARTIVTNLRGLSNSKDSVICYFEFNQKVERFYDIVAKEGHDCRVISLV